MLKKVNLSRYDKQCAVAYTVYMMAGSLFHRCFCRNGRLVRNLFLHYAEMTDPDVEDGVLSALDRLGQDFLDGLSDLNCEVSFRKEGDDFLLLFETGGFEGLEARVNKKGKFRIIPVKG